MQTKRDQIVARIGRLGDGKAFSAKDFLDLAARAIARKQRWKIVPDGAWAANLLGLSTQVPSKIVYLTDGPNKEVPIGRRIIYFKHARPKAMAGVEGKFALVVQALRHLGKESVGPREIKTLRGPLTPAA